MTVGDIIKNKVHELGGDGLVSLNSRGCGCGDKTGWFFCDAVNTQECQPAKWMYCIECKYNGQCEYQEYSSDIGIYDGCYLALQKEE